MVHKIVWLHYIDNNSVHINNCKITNRSKFVEKYTISHMYAINEGLKLQSQLRDMMKYKYKWIEGGWEN